MRSSLAGGGVHVHGAFPHLGAGTMAVLGCGGQRDEVADAVARWDGQALEDALTEPAPCFMCAETPWWRCHRRLIAELLTARGHEIVHLMRPGETQSHRLYAESSVRAGKLYLCGELVA